MTTSEAKKIVAEPDNNGAAKSNGETPSIFMPNAGAAGLMGGSALVMKQMVASSQELARFYSTRMKKDMSFMSALASCKTPQDLSEVWYNGVSSSLHDYVDEFDRILAMGLTVQTSDDQMRYRKS
jgi:hypothetical protein